MNGVFVGIILTMGVAGWFYYDDTSTYIQELEKRLAAYELKFETQEETLATMKNDFQMQTAALTELQAQSQVVQQEMNRYLDIFKRHNLTKLAAAKPGLIETRANKATKEVFDAIEADSIGLDTLDDGVQLAKATTPGSQDNNKTSGESNNSTSTSESN